MSGNRLSEICVQETLHGDGTHGMPRPSANGHAQKPPSPIRDNGEPAAPTAPAGTPGAATDARGRFASGKLGGPGNPFARQVAALRQAAVDAVSADEVRAIIAKMTEKALAGDVAAAKVVLSYAVGRPAAAP